MPKEYHNPNQGTDIDDYMIQIIDGQLFVRKSHDDKGKGKNEFPHFEPWMLGECIQVRNTTYGQFWKLIEPEMVMWNVLFRGATYGNDLTAWIGQMEAPFKKDDCKIDYISVYHAMQKTVWEGDASYASLNGFGGYGWSTFGPDEEPHPTPYGIGHGLQSFAKDLPFYIDEDFHIWYENLDKMYPNMNIDDLYIDKDVRKEWILWEVLHEIFFEITFYGTPERGEEILDEAARIRDEYLASKEVKEMLDED